MIWSNESRNGARRRPEQKRTGTEFEIRRLTETFRTKDRDRPLVVHM